MKKLLLVSLLGFFGSGLLFTSPSFAEDAAVTEKHDRACRSDVELHCKGVQPGEGRIMKCLQEHKDFLTPGCQAKGEAMIEKREAKKADRKAERAEKKAEARESIKKIREACKEDKKKFCKGVFGPMKVGACLKEHAAELSAGCAEAMK